MPFLTRWDDDSSRPSIGSALRDAAVRAVLPGVAVFAVIVGIGWVIMEPLRGFEAENGVSRWFQDRRTPTGETVTKFMSMIGNTEYVIAVGVLVALLVLWRTRQWWFAIVPILAISLQATIFVIATAVVGRPRPTVERLDPTPPTSSYPSGHVGASTALYVSFVLMATRLQNVVARRVLITLCVLAPLAVSFARLYRGAHHVTDVVVGLVNGLVCALLAWGYLRRDPAGATVTDGTGREPAAQSRA